MLEERASLFWVPRVIEGTTAPCLTRPSPPRRPQVHPHPTLHHVQLKQRHGPPPPFR
jgi:hypothetical protein